MSLPSAYLWLDLETTGLSPARHAIIEVAAILTGPDLRPLRTMHAVVRPDPADSWDPEVVAMHDRSGLRAQLGGPGVLDLQTAQALVVDMVDVGRMLDRSGGRPSVVLAGRSPHFDRGFLHARMPVLDARLDHRHLDVSTVDVFCRAAGMTVEPPARPHRAQPDVESARARYVELVDRVFKATLQPPVYRPLDGASPA